MAFGRWPVARRARRSSTGCKRKSSLPTCCKIPLSTQQRRPQPQSGCSAKRPRADGRRPQALVEEEPDAGPNCPQLPGPLASQSGEFPSSASRRDKLLFLLNYAVLAPSILNSQPWQFELSHHAIALHANPSRRLAVVDPDGRQSIISCGSALFNLRVAARAFGYEIDVSGPSGKSEPTLLAKLQLKPSATPPSQLDLELRDAIPRRRTVRSAFEDKPLGDELLRDLADAARKEGAECHFAQASEQKQQVAELVAEAEQVHLRDPAFRNELRDWLMQRRGEGHRTP
jgi:hypothetical protein